MILADDIRQVFINMQDKVYEVLYKFQLLKILPKIEIKPGLLVDEHTGTESQAIGMPGEAIGIHGIKPAILYDDIGEVL